ncbi:MAG: hypothetical protein JWO82_2533 [Akkermansiaceae bacterium]|nr:hypothetical protein [Akkermansiaceae bacterium]
MKRKFAQILAFGLVALGALAGSSAMAKVSVSVVGNATTTSQSKQVTAQDGTITTTNITEVATVVGNTTTIQASEQVTTSTPVGGGQYSNVTETTTSTTTVVGANPPVTTPPVSVTTPPVIAPPPAAPPAVEIEIGTSPTAPPVRQQ